MKCASCGSPDLEFFPGNYGRCRACGTTFAETLPVAPAHGAPGQGPMPYQPVYYGPPPQTPPKQATGTMIIVGIMAALFVAVAVAIMVANLGFNQSRREHDMPRPVALNAPVVEDVPPGTGGVEVEAPKQPVAKAEYRDVNSGSFGAGRMWIGRFFNVGEAPLSAGSVTLSLFDDSGKRVVEQTGYMPVDWLEPGQFTFVSIWVSKLPQFARQELKVRAEAANEYMTKPLNITITEQIVQRDAISGQLVGTVKNTQRVSVEFVKVVVYGYDDKGAPSGVYYAYATEKTLSPGQESGFSVMLGGVTVGKPVRYSAQAFARAR